MSKYLTAIVALAVSFFALTQGFGQTSTASAAGVTTVSISNVSCSGAGVDVTFAWPTLNKGPQYVYWSLQNNGFLEGTYSASAALPAEATSAMVSGLPSSSAIYVMVGTVISGKLEPGQTMVFSTTGICDGASYGTMPQYHGPGMYPNFMQQACNLFLEGYQGQAPFYGPVPYGFHDDYSYFLDEDEDDEDESDESDEGDEGDESDEDDESDEGDEDDDESDEDEDDEHDGYPQYPGILSYCLPQFGAPVGYGHYGDWSY